MAARTKFISAAQNRQNTMRDRMRGCFIGLAIGDALGTTLEFKPRDLLPPLTDIIGKGPFYLKPGEWTDDTAMAICLAESLLACGHFNPRDVMNRFVNWYRLGINSVNGTCFDIGSTVKIALDKYISTGNYFAGNTDEASAGNGSVMRLAAIPIFYAHDKFTARLMAVRQSSLTHAAHDALSGCAWLSDLLVDLIHGHAISANPHPSWPKTIQNLNPSALAKLPRNAIRSTGYVVDTLEAALWALATTDNFKDAVLAAANLADDADTVAAVAGQIAGAKYGYDAIPKEWLNKLAWHDKLLDIADGLANHGLGLSPTQKSTASRKSAAPLLR